MPIYPEQASNFAPQVDALMIFITGVCVFFAAAITIAIVFFFFKYHRKESTAVGIVTHEDSRLEAVWMIVPLILAMAMFGSGAVVYVDYRNTPHDTLDVYVVGKQWMWKAQQPNGLKEINELHVPVGRNHFFCSQYCGTNHALMGGWVTVMEPSDYSAWLSGSSGGSTNPAVAGEKLFAEKACITCHVANGTGPSPSLNGVYGAQVLLADGSTVTAEEAYIRESILQPNAKIVAGYPPLMPTFQGQLTEEQIFALTAYIKSLQSQPVPAKGYGIAPPTGKK
ncbi:MAG: hypothetical protein AUI02_01690 [Acidobacteria bacterium 13_2_20CM_2_57_12]|nr:MAG: hypothetical protein AUI02_01690 [Acidobacteria bacterium 13_2_20CM_2_57_12]